MADSVISNSNIEYLCYKTYRGPVSVLEMMEKTSAILMKDATLKDFRGENIG